MRHLAYVTIGTLALLLFVFVFGIRPALSPVVRATVADPIFTIGARESYDTALAQDKTVVKFGPMLFGLYPGGLAFENADAAHAHMLAHNWDPQKWAIYKLSGSYGQDSAGGYLTHSLLVLARQ